MGWNYLSILKLQRCSHKIWEWISNFITHFCKCDYSSTFRVKRGCFSSLINCPGKFPDNAYRDVLLLQKRRNYSSVQFWHRFLVVHFQYQGHRHWNYTFLKTQNFYLTHIVLVARKAKHTIWSYFFIVSRALTIIQYAGENDRTRTPEYFGSMSCLPL